MSQPERGNGEGEPSAEPKLPKPATELSGMTWRRGQHVIVLGDYKPLAEDFQPSVPLKPEK
jgi:hypothetical protein